MASNLCSVCGGACNVVRFAGRPLFSTCTACDGTGVVVRHGPAVIVLHGKPAKKRRPANDTAPPGRVA